MVPPWQIISRFYKGRKWGMIPSVNASRILLAVCLAIFGAIDCFAGAVIREPGAIYLEDFTAHPVLVPVKASAPIFYQPDLARFLGTLRGGQQVQLQAVLGDVYRVRGLAQQGQVVGWLPASALAPLKKEFLESLKQNAARHEAIADLISKNEVAVNMTPDEVVASLGKPAKKTSRLDAAGHSEVWEFVKFERIPQERTGYDQYGRLINSVIYIKVPSGKISVIFDNSLVTAIEQTEGNIEKEARVRLVPAPLVFAN